MTLRFARQPRAISADRALATSGRDRCHYALVRSRALAATVLVLGLALTLGAGSLFIRVRYASWPLAGYPNALHYCDRTYNRFDDREQNKEVTEPMYAAFTYHAPLVPSHLVFADTAKGDHFGDSPACAGFLFIKTNASRVIIYKIVGDA
jgi:hypothetical protein